MSEGVKVVGAPTQEEVTEEAEEWPSGLPDAAPARPRERPRAPGYAERPRRARERAVRVFAVLGLAGTLAFGLLWANAGSASQDSAVKSAARSFLIDLTNFNAQSIDADFSAITAMATGTFSGQANQFFNSAIRIDLEKALADSRGQIRDLYVQSDNGQEASIYAVVDQVYVNNKITTPQSDVLRIVVDLQKVGSSWKIADVTTLEGASPASTGSGSGSSGSDVAGQ